MNDWMIRWAFAAPFVTIGTQPCGVILIVALISYSLAFFTIRVRTPWGGGVAICLSMLIIWARVGLAIVVLEPPTPDKFLIATEFSVAGFFITAILPLLGLLAGKNFPPLRRWPVLAWDSLFGISYLLGFLSCGPYFATLSASAATAGGAGITQLGAYALGLLILTITFMLIVAMFLRFLMMRFVSESNVHHIRVFALLALAITGLLRLWI